VYVKEKIMDYLTKIIDEAAKKLGSQRDLENYLDLAPRHLTEVKGGRRGLPDIAQAKLEELMGLQTGALRAPSAIITEKKPERRAYWEKKLERLAAMVLLGVISVVTPTPSEAAPLLQVPDSTLYIMSNRLRRFRAKTAAIFAAFFDALPTIAVRPLCCPG
jgi:hypothetical protein